MEVAVGDSGPPQTRHIVDSGRTTCAQILPLIAFCHHDHGGLKILGGRLGTAILPRSLRPFLILVENVIVQEKREGWVGLLGRWVAVPEKFWRNAVKMHNSLSHQRLLQCNHFVFMQPQLKSQCRKNAERLEVASRPVEAEDCRFSLLFPLTQSLGGSRKRLQRARVGR